MWVVHNLQNVISGVGSAGRHLQQAMMACLWHHSLTPPVVLYGVSITEIPAAMNPETCAQLSIALYTLHISDWPNLSVCLFLPICASTLTTAFQITHTGCLVSQQRKDESLYDFQMSCFLLSKVHVIWNIWNPKQTSKVSKCFGRKKRTCFGNSDIRHF